MMHDKLKLRELGNVIGDYQMQCLDSPREAIMNLLVNELFQTKSQAEEKYQSYFIAGSTLFLLRRATAIKWPSRKNINLKWARNTAERFS
jgi:hypothetical protein